MMNCKITKIINLRTNLTKKSLRDNLNVFIARELLNIKFIQVILKIKTIDNKFLSLSKSLMLNVNDNNELIQWKDKIVSNFQQLNENYKSVSIIQLIFHYKEIDFKFYKDNLWRNPW